MTNPGLHQTNREPFPPYRALTGQMFSRAAGVPLVPGNSVRILKDAAENYPAWLEAMTGAKKMIHFESYLIHEDDEGRTFAKVLAAKAQEGVQVRIIYDWLGALGKTSPGFWKDLRASGVEVRCFNPPQFESPLGWLTRDHRKLITIDGQTGFVSGLCVGAMWVGDPKKSIEPWRDTGVEVKGPAVAVMERAFAQVWDSSGEGLLSSEIPQTEPIVPAGNVKLRVVASAPNTAGIYRLDQLIAALARRSLWLTDAYFVGMTPYVQALRAAAADGVDVRLLVPSGTDIPIVRAISRAGYQPLLEAGVRVFEWNGPMLHAKTAVADGRWARVGSTNLNPASWIGNYELDVVVENKEFACGMEDMYLDDLANSTEIVLSKRHKVLPLAKRPRRPRRRVTGAGGSTGRMGTGAIRIGNMVGAAITNRRVLVPAETRLMIASSIILLAIAVMAALWPRWIAFPLAVLCAFFAASLFVRGYKLHRKQKAEGSTTSETKKVE